MHQSGIVNGFVGRLTKHSNITYCISNAYVMIGPFSGMLSRVSATRGNRMLTLSGDCRRHFRRRLDYVIVLKFFRFLPADTFGLHTDGVDTIIDTFFSILPVNHCCRLVRFKSYKIFMFYFYCYCNCSFCFFAFKVNTFASY